MDTYWATKKTVLGWKGSSGRHTARLLIYLRGATAHQRHVRYVVEELGEHDESEAEQILVAGYAEVMNKLRKIAHHNRLGDDCLESIIRRELSQVYSTTINHSARE